MYLKSLMIFLLMMISGIAAKPQQAEFFREDLGFTLDSSRFVLNGLYYFRNTGDRPVRQNLFYPYPDVALYGPVDSVFAHLPSDTASLLVTRLKSGCIIRLQVPPFGQTVIRIGYTQHLTGNRARYIVTTTQNWKAPFDTADYALTIPAGFRVKTFSIPPDTVVNISNGKRYEWHREHFMPDRDFEFTF